MTYLLNCPFCGIDGNESKVLKDRRTNRYQVQCNYCEILSADFDTPQEAIEYWNTRPDLPITEHFKQGFYAAKNKMIDFLNSEPEIDIDS